ncbi:hypothetical protein JZO77_13595 [Enterococcus hulanensis]|uniref:XkdX family protein n=1 Tax=Enterococcus hulanensis TaxID=2559929 RepID=A0ABU3F1D3_9ENTE|nr:MULTISPECIES: hypothetical protein [Enterococcus]MBO0413047.1 hypothetical protein [Enterococcus hulanensis]MBO0457769.1 hypothetical protein [Enterococcus hulanensis]MDT2600929.1 hypothetical protein [Enterococcus hulanensis]MDT2611517.1 hypothetical protein [Enterococcus hulanensis]MDT2617998.1 hypothetical protein [Enterococcus hulanensis]
MNDQQKEALAQMETQFRTLGATPIQALYKLDYSDKLSKEEFEMVTKVFVRNYLFSEK